VTPREAGQVELEEPDWRERFEEHANRWPKLPPYLAWDNAFEAVMREWRQFHFTWVELGGKAKRNPAGATEAMIALARLKIFPARFLIKDVPRTDACGYQADEHMWLSIRQEQWRITGVEDRMLCLEKRFEDKPETMQIDLAKAKWTKYCDAAAAALADL
jgi:hypothetical protein